MQIELSPLVMAALDQGDFLLGAYLSLTENSIKLLSGLVKECDWSNHKGKFYLITKFKHVYFFAPDLEDPICQTLQKI